MARAAKNLDDLLENGNWEAWHARYQEYCAWVIDAMDDFVAYADRLTPGQLAALEAEYQKVVTGRRYGLVPWMTACTIAHNPLRSATLGPALADDLKHLRSLGEAVDGAAHALIGQGQVSDRKYIDLLAGPWLACGHDLPRTSITV